jgi:3-dehydro-L-gulonate 2-dehydrogenase
MENELRIPYEDLRKTFLTILLNHGFRNDNADLCATVFADNSVDGVYTHGVNRFPRFVSSINDGQVVPENKPVKIGGFGALEQWDGQLGPGPLNALSCTDRALELAEQNGIGCVALANTNHWMRGGTYGWRAAKKGYAFICWTNTIANMPAWGATDSRLGNNPVIFAIPKDEEAIVLDMAVSQFSYGAMEKLAMQNKQLPVVGGYDESGNLTSDPSQILKTMRTIPVGYWKGSGLALLLDLLAVVLSGGKSTFDISQQKKESALSQVFIAIKLSALENASSINLLIKNIIDDYHNSVPNGSNDKIQYPGERVLQTRKENMEKGIPVDLGVWQQIRQLLN